MLGLYSDPDFVVADFGGEGFVFEGFGEAVLAGGDFKLPAVPRAGDDARADSTLSEWATGVGTDAIEGVDLVAFAEEGDDVLSGHDFESGLRGDVVEIGDANPVHGEYPE